jgi:serine/threonine protein phosphatase PrpC
VEPAVSDGDKGWQSLLPDGIERWLRGRKAEDATVGRGVEWRPSAGVAAPGVSSPDPALQYRPPGVEWTPAPDAPRSLDSEAFTAAFRPCAQCGGVVDNDGYCTVCGFKAVSERDHYREEPAPWVAGVCDHGLKHARNEDALALAASQEPGLRAVLVLCDGVSSSIDSDVASLAAAEAARDLLWDTCVTRADAATDAPSLEHALVAAAAAANEAVVRTTDPDSDNAASATFVAVVIERGALAFGNLGDSRAYWLPDGGEPVQLTRDDSVAETRVAAGEVTREEAENGPGAHAITRWLGSDAPDITPRTGRLEVGDGWVLACTDGLWNYGSTAPDIRTVLDAALAAAPGNLVDMCEHMVAWANGQGGRDNITVALARLGQTAEPGQTAEAEGPA